MAVPLLLWLISSCSKMTRDIYFNNSSVICSLLLRAGIYNPSPQEYFVLISLKTPIGNIPTWILHSVLMLRRNVSKPCGWVPARLSTSPWGINHPVYLILMPDNDYTLSFAEEQQKFCLWPCLQAGSPAAQHLLPRRYPKRCQTWWDSTVVFVAGHAARWKSSSSEDALPIPGAKLPNTLIFRLRFVLPARPRGPGSPRREGATGNVVGEILRVRSGDGDIS